MYLSKENLVYYKQIFSKIKENDCDFVEYKSKIQFFLKLLDNILNHIKKDNKLKKFTDELYLEYGGDHSGGIFNIATTRGSSLLLVESWFDDIKTLENKFNELHSNIVIFLNLNKSTLEFNNQVEKIILLCDNIFTESSLLAKRINNFLKEEHYQHYLLDNTKNLDEFETNIISWLK